MLNEIKYSVIVPIYNEEKVVRELYDRIKKIIETYNEPYEIIFVDDGSRDSSFNIIKGISMNDSAFKYVKLRKNFGQTGALAAGFDFAQGEFIISMDGDLQHLPEDIPKLISKMEEGYDIVSGWRKERKDNAVMRKFPSRVANWLMYKMSGVNIHDFGTTLKIYKKEIIKSVKLYGEMHRFIPALAAKSGISIAEVPIENPSRLAGKSNYGISRTFRVIFDLLTVKFLISYSTRPFHVFGFIGLLFFLTGFFIDLVFSGFWLLTDVSYENHKGLILFSVLMIIIGLQFFVFGILSEILIRIYYESTGEKIYSVKETNFSEEITK
jgi:glycosyltransferase involved in cell wall biosynthesis